MTTHHTSGAADLPEALRLADLLMDLQTHLGPRRDEKDPDEQRAWDAYTDAAAELRRLHALAAGQAVAPAEPLHITHGPLMRHAAALLRSRKPVLPDHEDVAAELERAVDGHPTPSGAPSAEWLEVARIAENEARPAPLAMDGALKEMEARKDAAYLERNQVVAALASVYPSGIARTAIEGWSDDWHGCVYIDLPTGQASWHYHNSHAHLFAHLPAYQGKWDGHTTEDIKEGQHD